MNKIKLLFLTSGDVEKNATIKRASGLSKHLVEIGNYDVTIMALDCKGNKERFEHENLTNVNLIYFPLMNSLKELIFKISFIKKNQFDVIYVTSPCFRNSVINFRNSKDHSIYLVEYSELASSIKTHKFLRRKFLEFLENKSTSWYDGFVAASKYLYDYYKPNILEKNMVYLPYAFPTYYSDKIKNQKIINTDSDFNIFYMGTIIKNYGFNDLIELAKKIIKNNLNMKISVLGGGIDLNEAKNYIQKNQLSNVIKMYGYVPEKEVFKHCFNADVFICPLNDTVQDWARCPSKIYYYIPFEKPIITSKIGEPFQIFGESGLYYKIGDVNALLDIVKGVKTLEKFSFSPSSHSWLDRAHKFDKWLKLNFIKL